jgi:hypothetical protein
MAEGPYLVRGAGTEQLGRAEDHRSSRLDDHLFSRLGISTPTLALVADHERSEARDLDFLPVPQAALDVLEDDLDQAGSLTVRDAAVALVDNPRDVGLGHERSRSKGPKLENLKGLSLKS